MEIIKIKHRPLEPFSLFRSSKDRQVMELPHKQPNEIFDINIKENPKEYIGGFTQILMDIPADNWPPSTP
jgi:hypothetical protein